jgi:hypothetical protein
MTTEALEPGMTPKRAWPSAHRIAEGLRLFRVGSFSCQSFGLQSFQVFAQRFLLLFVFGKGLFR